MLYLKHENQVIYTSERLTDQSAAYFVVDHQIEKILWHIHFARVVFLSLVVYQYQIMGLVNVLVLLFEEKSSKVAAESFVKPG